MACLLHLYATSPLVLFHVVSSLFKVTLANLANMIQKENATGKETQVKPIQGPLLADVATAV